MNDHNPFSLFQEYEKRFNKKVLRTPIRLPWDSQDREEIISLSKQLLGIKDEWVPEIKCDSIAITEKQDYQVEHFRTTSWEGCRGAAYLYTPKKSTESPLPIVFLACGHGVGCKSSLPYSTMATHLVLNGFAVLVSDNIGQAERVSMGHRDVTGVFECGLSLQGLIIMESMGWIDWIRNQDQLDSQKISIIGNSGGGLLTLFLGAYKRDQLFSISSSGYPNTFEFIARKEKKHCHCNILPGFIGKLEMWQLYGCIAPKPLFLFQGSEDHFFPEDIFYRNARKVATVYQLLNAKDVFWAKTTKGGHTWDEERYRLQVEHLCNLHGFTYQDNLVPPEELSLCYGGDTPYQSVSVDQVAMNLTETSTITSKELWDVFPPKELSEEETEAYVRGNANQVFAQFEAYMKE